MTANKELLGIGPRMPLNGKLTRHQAHDMQMAYTDNMAENPEAEDDEEEDDDTSKVSVETLFKYISRLDEGELETLNDLMAQMNGADDEEKEEEMTNKLGTDAKARAERITSDEGFKKSVREAAGITQRRIAVDDQMASDKRNAEGFASRWGANGSRIQIDHAGLQGIPERSK